MKALRRGASFSRIRFQSSAVLKNPRPVEIVAFARKNVEFRLQLNAKEALVKIPPLWLRWNCECTECKQKDSGQKTLNPLDWPQTIDLENIWFEDDLIKFKLQNDDHLGEISFETLRNFYTNENQRNNGATKMTFHNYPEEWIPEMTFEQLKTDKGQFYLTTQISVNGYCLVKECSTEKDSVLSVAEKVSTVIPSVYGMTFDVLSKSNPNNIAYSNVALPAHVDLTYFEAPPGLQYFLCRRNDECVEGGQSTLVDAFAAAESLRQKAPNHFETLTKTLVRFQKIHYERENPVHLEWESTHFVLGTDGDVVRVNWAPAFEGLSKPESLTDEYFAAYKAYLIELEKSPTNFARNLTPGDCLVFNNRRMLHGRTKFELNGGVRHLEGCYTNLCEFRSRAQVMENLHGSKRLIQKVGNSNNI